MINLLVMGLFSGLIGGVLAWALAAIAKRGLKKGVRDPQGWKSLHSSWIMHLTFAGSIALFSFFALFAWGGGSTRPDAVTQNLVAGGILIFLGIVIAYTGWTYYGRIISWRGGKLRVRNIFGSERVRRYSDIDFVEWLSYRQEYRVRFSDGSSLVFSMYMHGANEFVARLPFKDFWDL